MRLRHLPPSALLAAAIAALPGCRSETKVYHAPTPENVERGGERRTEQRRETREIQTDRDGEMRMERTTETTTETRQR